jgi:hypothetical protein
VNRESREHDEQRQAMLYPSPDAEPSIHDASSRLGEIAVRQVLNPQSDEAHAGSVAESADQRTRRGLTFDRWSANRASYLCLWSISRTPAIQE